ncbi:helix-turn-helix transcriptional regulator [Hyphomicrobium sp. NDB2Meth4]|uniref:helix-turn-helix domain-containing protein n=1 Tax=Hyphomicrobium sp. NDB2Meth4 TaxID=1892846 RepID=UPI000AB819E2|nr:helix-turn-helix transcriptional regulator [Hyphomicrobium sp. NDB2Meth4]
MTIEMPKIAAVSVVTPNLIDVTWATGRSERIDLTGWIATGSTILAPLTDPAVFATARVDKNGSGVSWGGDDDLAIDAFHLSMIAGDAADVAAYDAAKGRHARGEDELIPAAFADRLLDGENKIRVWREYRGLSVEALASAAGIATDQIRQIEDDARSASPDDVGKIAAALRIDVDDLA